MRPTISMAREHSETVLVAYFHNLYRDKNCWGLSGVRVVSGKSHVFLRSNKLHNVTMRKGSVMQLIARFFVSFGVEETDEW